MYTIKKVLVFFTTAIVIIVLSFFATTVQVNSSFPYFSMNFQHKHGLTTLERAVAAKQKHQELDKSISVLMNRLEDMGVKFIDYENNLSTNEKTKALRLLDKLAADKTAQDLFKQFNERGIGFVLARNHAIYNGYVTINVRQDLDDNIRWLRSTES